MILKMGIIGQQKFENVTVENWVRRTISNILKELEPKIGISSLAPGSDQIFAEEVVRSNGLLHVVVPCKAYEETFRDRNVLKKYEDLLSQASNVAVLNFNNVCDHSFFEAGKEVVNSSDCLIFVWNKLPTDGAGRSSEIFTYSIQPQKKMFLLDVSLMEVEFFKF